MLESILRPTRLLALLLLTPLAAAQHRLVTQGDGQVAIVAADGTFEWVLPWGPIHDIAMLPNGNLMMQRGASEVVEIEVPRGVVVWSYDSATLNGNEGKPVEVHSFQPLPDGRVMIAESGPGRIIEVDRLGRIQHEVILHVDWPHPHTDTRLVRKLENGNYLVCHERDGAVREYDGATGEVVWEYDVPLFGREPADGHDHDGFGNKCFAALRLESGNTLVSTGNGHSVLEVTPEGEIAWKIGQDDLKGIRLAWVTTLEALPNGNYVIGNCHAGPEEPVLIEVDPRTNEVVWTFDGFKWFGNSVSNSALLDVGPEAELLNRARAIHRRVVTLDTHKDISSDLASEELPEDERLVERFVLRNDPTVWGMAQVDFPKMLAGGLDVAFFIVYVGQGPLTDEGFERAESQAREKFEAIHRMCRRYPDRIELARTPADVERIAASGKLVACIGIENGYAMGTNLALIEEYHRLGARYMSLTHNRHSQLGDSNTPADEPLHGGLSDLGRKAIEELNRVGILVDVSHAGQQTTLEAIAHSKAPVIASHSGVDAVFEHGRNLSDEELLALKANGGVIQCVAFASYVKDDGARREAALALREELGLPTSRRAPVDESPEGQEKLRKLRAGMVEIEARFPPSNVSDFADHIDYAVSLIGIDHVAISSDFDGGGGVVGWNDASETFNVTLELVRRGYTEEQIAKLWSGNTLRIWREVERVAKELQGG